MCNVFPIVPLYMYNMELDETECLMLTDDNDRVKDLHHNDAESTLKIIKIGCFKSLSEIIYY